MRRYKRRSLADPLTLTAWGTSGVDAYLHGGYSACDESRHAQAYRA
ncbi:hypothetical protein HMPREF9595_02608 [Cutibacterium acnes HL005PA2]|nr:hypothetical protein HMPREF9598_00414 [Cutibacterium acnes HL050PA1]EFT23118.1 hypothetical protein HMPREF9573_01597 [Cutibacterium acnes HL072PA2]EFT30093.1 hypothetical protein HMPREF9595_02608 [Cutibacterium acnes HL005PA2]EFT33396.1 hypothetical protein HMPREF9596_01791 [Cutibacterium acnes HL005PA3]EFT56968.1 hypothetical protein HMPREF9610_00103 [Cutibacterium acnes HL027PA2]EFT78613.1 hypothetical protein HMPREF9601_01133 [Cutibacterium acnes HL030PA1]EFT82545.1 hypothetical protein